MKNKLPPCPQDPNGCFKHEWDKKPFRFDVKPPPPPLALNLQAWIAKLAAQRHQTTETHLRSCIMAIEGLLPPDDYIIKNLKAVINIPEYRDSTVYFYKDLPIVRTAPLNTSKEGKITDTIWVADLEGLREINAQKLNPV